MNYLIYNPINRLFWCHGFEGFTGWGHRDTASKWDIRISGYIPSDGIWVTEDSPIVKNWQDPDGPFEIFYADLTEDAKKRFANFYPDAQIEMNLDTTPLAVIDSYSS